MFLQNHRRWLGFCCIALLNFRFHRVWTGVWVTLFGKANQANVNQWNFFDVLYWEYGMDGSYGYNEIERNKNKKIESAWGWGEDAQ